MNCEHGALVEWCILWVIKIFGMVSNGLTVIPDLMKIRPDYRLKTAGHLYLVSLFVMGSVQRMHTTDAQEYVQ